MDYNDGNGWNDNQWNNDWQQQEPPPFQRQPVFFNGELNRSVLKTESKVMFRNNYATVLAMTILPLIISAGISAIPVVGFILSWIFSPILYIGGIYVILGIIRNRNLRSGNIFDIFGRFGNVFGAYFTTDLLLLLWYICLIVPGIFKSFSWAMVPFLLADNPDMTGTEARDLSTEMMYGHKWEFFKLILSFIGWFLLSSCTFGIFGLFYVNPWFITAICDYYDNLRMLHEAEQQSEDSAF